VSTAFHCTRELTERMTRTSATDIPAITEHPAETEIADRCPREFMLGAQAISRRSSWFNDTVISEPVEAIICWDGADFSSPQRKLPLRWSLAMLLPLICCIILAGFVLAKLAEDQSADVPAIFDVPNGGRFS